MEYETIKTLKQSEKSTVLLVREKGSGKLMIQKKLQGQHPVYLFLQKNPHSCLPAIYEAAVTQDFTTIIEEYIEDCLPDGQLSEKQFLGIVRDLCSVLEFLHGQGIIHRDIKPSNILMAKDGHIRLIDFDAARNYRENAEDAEQDTVLLGTRGFAPPEQYGFTQTDQRADIYALGVTLGLLGGKLAEKPRYRRILQKCTNLDPQKRYPSARQLHLAFFRPALSFRGQILPHGKSVICGVFCAFLALCAPVFAWRMIPSLPREGHPAERVVLPAPANPHWDGETGIAVWGNVPESGGETNYAYTMVVYRKTHTEDPEWITVETHSLVGAEHSLKDGNFCFALAENLTENGFYYFTVSARGDSNHYLDSPYVASDVFAFTGESAPRLPLPENVTWLHADDRGYPVFDHLDQYDDKDQFSVMVYDKYGNLVYNMLRSKEWILSGNTQGIPFQYFSNLDAGYSFSVQVITSRPNKYRSSAVSDPMPIYFQDA